MDPMNIDAPSDPGPLKPRDRILRRLAEFGIPEEVLLSQFLGIVDYARKHPDSVTNLVWIILPPDEEVAVVLKECKAGPKKSLSPSMKNRFRECMVWLQWIMFLDNPANALKRLSEMSSGRGVCGAVWGKNDIAYKCRTCEHDPTCAICVPCFQNGNHKDHDYSIFYTGGGCCDCGDVTAWKREGFCSKHKGAEQIMPLPEEFDNSVGPVLDALLEIWMDNLIAADALRGSDGVLVEKKVANELTFALVEMLIEFCNQSESLLSFVSQRINSLSGLLKILVKAERFLSEGVARKLSELLLKLLGEPFFKSEFAKVFLSYYPVVIHEAIIEGSDDAYKKYPLLSTFSVQIFTVPTLTPRLVKEMNLLPMLLGCLGDIFIHCSGEDGHLQVSKWGNLYETTMRVVEDIRFIMSHGVVPKYVTHYRKDLLKTWMILLSFLQGLDPLKRETGLHIEEENENINLPFILGHSIASIHLLLVDGAFSMPEEMDCDKFFCLCKQEIDEGDSVRHSKVGRLSKESSVYGMTGSGGSVSASSVTEVKSQPVCHPLIPSSVTWLTYECLKAIETSLGATPITSNISRSNYLALKGMLSTIRKGSYLFGSLTRSSEEHSKQFSPPLHSHFRASDVERTNNFGLDGKAVASSETDFSGLNDSFIEADSATELDALNALSLSDWPEVEYNVTSQDVSMHIPLHRLLSLLLQKALRKFYGEFALLCKPSGSTELPLSANCDDIFRCLLGGCHPCGFSAFIMEHPLRNRVFFAEVHAGMWNKNGDTPILSCEWYRSVRWAEQGLELDLFLLQCCAALAPADLFVGRIVERFGLLEYLSLGRTRSSEYEPVLVQEMLKLIIQIVQERRFSGMTPADNLRRELVHKLSTGDATHSQLVKSLPRDLSKSDELQEILEIVAAYSNPSGFNQGMYSLRWAYWKELDLYHPQWNLRELQVAEERYMRYCNVSALTTQLPRWRKIYPPLRGVARIATCKAVLQIIRAVLFYAVFTDEFTEARAPDGVLLTALHLLSLALDICFEQKANAVMSFCTGDCTPILAFAGEEIYEKSNYGAGGQSLLSLLVSLMRMHKRENLNFLEAGSCNLSSLIESLLKKFAEIDFGCMAQLQQLAPEMVVHLSQLAPSDDTTVLSSSSDNEKRKAKARERQAAILAKMKAEQSKFLSSINSGAGDDSKSELDESNTDGRQYLEDSAQVVCSLCHDSNSKSPVSFFTLLQKSRLLSFVDKGPPSWDQVWQSDRECIPRTTNRACDPSEIISSSSGLKVVNQPGNNSFTSHRRMFSSPQLAQLVQIAINDFSRDAQPGEVNTLVEFFRARLPSLSTQVQCTDKDAIDETVTTFENLEEDMYLSIREEVSDEMLLSSYVVINEKFVVTEGCQNSGRGAESLLLGKYIAALSRERTKHAGLSENCHDDMACAESTSNPFASNGFGAADCDGIHLSSCGHAVHQGCLDRYLLSLKERHVRRIVFGHIVDPDQGEFLCPVCRQMANSTLPSLPGDFQEVLKQPLISTVGSSIDSDPLAHPNAERNSLWLPQALSLLQSAANMVEKGDNLKTFSIQKNERMRLNLDSFSCMLAKNFVSNKLDKFTGYTGVNHAVIMWDTLIYTLVSMEIASRCGRSNMTPTYGLNALYEELNSSSGFTLSLLLKIVHCSRRNSSLHVLQRFRSIQLFADSVCSGASSDCTSSTNGSRVMSYILKHFEEEIFYPDAQFWNRAADPVIAHDAFSSLLWVIFCLPYPFLSCEESLLSLIHVFYVVSVVQAIITYFGKHQYERESGFQECLVTDISKILRESEWIQQYFLSNSIDSSAEIRDIVRKLIFPYLRRCALLWKLLSTSIPAPFCDKDHRDHVFNSSSVAFNETMDNMVGDLLELNEVNELEKMFKLPPLDDVLNDQELRSLVSKWLNHFSKEYEVHNFQRVLHITPVVPLKLMHLPHVYQDLLQRYIKQRCSDCKNVLVEPALCLLCGKLCSPNWKPCCRESGCQTHAIACGAGTGVFLLIKRTTILLHRCARQASWPSPYLDSFGEEDIDMQRGKPLYLNEERYAYLSYMVASHGLDQSSRALGQTTGGTFFIV